MNSQETLVEVKVFQNLVQDFGLSDTRKLMASMEYEWQKHIKNICLAIEERSLETLAKAAATLQNIALLSGAYKLADLLAKLESAAIRQYEDAFTLAQNALNLADMTRFAYQDMKLTG